jgi:NitT/TauT family transport system permease protein
LNFSSPNNLAGMLQRLAVWLVLLAAWEGAYRVIGWKAYNFPAPSHVADSLLGMLKLHTAFGEPVRPGWPAPPEPANTSGGLIGAVLVSGARLSVGFCIGILIGGMIGMAIWRFEPFDQFLGPVLLGVQTLPSVCWVPLGIVFLGLTESAIMFVLVMGSFSAIAISLRDGLRTMPPLYRRAGVMLGASGWKLYRYVLLPASLPAVATSLRQGFSFAWRSLLGAEMLLATAHHGLGLKLQISRDIGGPADVVAIMIVMILIGMLADRWVFARLQAAVNTRFGLSQA